MYAAQEHIFRRIQRIIINFQCLSDYNQNISTLLFAIRMTLVHSSVQKLNSVYTLHTNPKKRPSPLLKTVIHCILFGHFIFIHIVIVTKKKIIA